MDVMDLMDSPPPAIVPEPGTLIAAGQYWTVILNRNQNLLGKVLLLANRPVARVTALSAEEWLDVRDHIQRATSALVAAFQPDHFNYAFLQNQDRQVHLHIIPRYAATRSFAGLAFADPDYPDHYAVPGPVRTLELDQRAALADTIRGCLPH